MKNSIKTQSNSIILIAAASLFATAAVGATPGLQAAEQGDVLTQNVAYGDLDLNSQKGVAVLYARLRNAARIVCVRFEGRDLDNQKRWIECYDHALTTAVTAINKPTVTAFHNQIIHRSDKG